MSSSSKFFSENVAIPAATATSMATLLRTAGFGFERDPVTNAITAIPSLDSIDGIGASIVPAGIVYVGHDQFVRDAAVAGPPRLYKGALAAVAQKFGLDDFVRGVIDPNEVWFYSAGGTTADLVFKAF